MMRPSQYVLIFNDEAAAIIVGHYIDKNCKNAKYVQIDNSVIGEYEVIFEEKEVLYSE